LRFDFKRLWYGWLLSNNSQVTASYQPALLAVPGKNSQLLPDLISTLRKNRTMPEMRSVRTHPAMTACRVESRQRGNGAIRLAAASLLFLLAACGEAKTDHAALANVEAEQRAATENDGNIVCARQGSSDFARVCTVDREQVASGLILTVRHPDGAFHRLLVTKDGRGVIAADGAEKAVVTVLDKDSIEVALGGDRYRLPATVHGKTSPKS